MFQYHYHFIYSKRAFFGLMFGQSRMSRISTAEIFRAARPIAPGLLRLAPIWLSPSRHHGIDLIASSCSRTTWTFWPWRIHAMSSGALSSGRMPTRSCPSAGSAGLSVLLKVLTSFTKWWICWSGVPPGLSSAPSLRLLERRWENVRNPDKKHLYIFSIQCSKYSRIIDNDQCLSVLFLFITCELSISC